MAEVDSSLIFETLKNIQGRLDKIDAGIGESRHEIVSLRLSQMSMQNDIHNIYGVLARNDERLERIEHRLELRELAEKPQSPYEPPRA
ncbi:MAG TPA: hypothetical protein VGM46_00170 [Mesorhizobium sp.]